MEGETTMTNAEQQRKIFWEMFDNELDSLGRPFSIAYRTHYATVNRRSSNSNYCLSMDFLVAKGFLRIGIYMRDNIPVFTYMYENKDEIEEKLGFKPMWTMVGERNTNTRRIEIHIPFKPDSIPDYLSLIRKAIPYIMKFKEVIPTYSSEPFFDF